MYLTLAKDDPTEQELEVNDMVVDPDGSISVEFTNGTRRVIPGTFKMPSNVDHDLSFIMIALSVALLQAHERIDAIEGLVQVQTMPGREYKYKQPAPVRQGFFRKLFSIFN